ncbi:hypothetical protein EV175_004497 [Coemansia sp. RSA 1933]|nr:hypothetical protein EV175_004497 [Coemansia sp. RSA 1933]
MNLSENDVSTETSNKGVPERDRCYVAVHVGAGYHSARRANEYRTAMKHACMAAMRVLRSHKDASDAVEAAIMEL